MIFFFLCRGGFGLAGCQCKNVTSGNTASSVAYLTITGCFVLSIAITPSAEAGPPQADQTWGVPNPNAGLSWLSAVFPGGVFPANDCVSRLPLQELLDLLSFSSPLGEKGLGVGGSPAHCEGRHWSIFSPFPVLLRVISTLDCVSRCICLVLGLCYN